MMYHILCLLIIATATRSQLTFISGYASNITSWQFSEKTGTLDYIASSNAFVNPSWMSWTKDKNFIYAVNEVVDPDGGAVMAFSVDRENSTLKFVNAVPSGGGSPCFISIQNSQKWVFVANYDDGYISIIPIDSATGEVGQAIYNEKHGEHAHMMLNDKSGKFVLAAFLGSDYIAQFVFDENTGILVPNSPPYAKTPPGSGPRHFVFHPTEKWVFIVTETSSTVITCRYDPTAGILTPIHTISTTPPNFNGSNTGAEILISPSGKYVYASNRGHNSIAIFSFDPNSETLSAVGWEQGNGSITTPRGVTMDATGNHLLVASQGANLVTTFAINADGTLTLIQVVTGLPSQPSFVGIIGQ